MTTYRPGTHHGVTINRQGDGHQCGRDGHDCARGHLVAVVTNDDWDLAERICALLNAGPLDKAGPDDEACGKAHPASPYTCQRRAGHDVCVSWQAGNGSDAWTVDYADLVNQIQQLREALANLVDPDPCGDYDHHGNCQTHMATIRGVCAHARAKELLGRADEHTEGHQ